jgi:hypothetical protein
MYLHQSLLWVCAWASEGELGISVGGLEWMDCPGTHGRKSIGCSKGQYTRDTAGAGGVQGEIWGNESRLEESVARHPAKS